jgi:hypothetical protein
MDMYCFVSIVQTEMAVYVYRLKDPSFPRPDFRSKHVGIGKGSTPRNYRPKVHQIFQ